MAYRYSPVALWLHWLTAALVLAMIVVGIWMTYFEPKDEAFKFLLYDVHESVGAALFVLVLVRLLRRLANHWAAPGAGGVSTSRSRRTSPPHSSRRRSSWCRSPCAWNTRRSAPAATRGGAAFARVG